jgi:carbon-monoxide dehydrogenase iron sulfur subunit
MKGMIIVDVDKCNACKSCEIACAVEHSVSKDLYQAIHEDPRPRARVSVQQGISFSVPLQCRQCANAPCIALCPTKALYRQDEQSPVLLDEEKCIGCDWCVLACPFGVIRLDEGRHVVVKCDQCFERVQRGELPACVAACPTGALAFKELEKVREERRDGYLVEIAQCLSGGDV